MSAFDLSLAVDQYTTNVEMLVQQKGSRLMPSVMIGNHVGKKAAVVDQFAAATARRVTSRYAPLVPADLQNDRRWVSPADYDWNDLTDEFDKLRLIVDPTSHYVTAAVSALLRAVDDEIITAMYGTALTGETGTTSTSFLSGNQMSVNIGGTASGLNVQKLVEAQRILMSHDIDLETEPLFCVITSKQHANLMNEIQITNSDYAATKVLVDGKLKSFLGINFIHSERLPVNGSSYRRVPVYAKSALHLGMWNNIQTSVDKMPGLGSQPYQVYAKMTCGATRTQEKKIVEIPCAEA